jgi:transcriptional regulator with XRE-family HTH domain
MIVFKESFLEKLSLFRDKAIVADIYGITRQYWSMLTNRRMPATRKIIERTMELFRVTFDEAFEVVPDEGTVGNEVHEQGEEGKEGHAQWQNSSLKQDTPRESGTP